MWIWRGGILRPFFLENCSASSYFSRCFLIICSVFSKWNRFPPGMAVKAKINLLLYSLAVGMDNIGKTMINTWFCDVFWEVLEGLGMESWLLEKRGAKNMDQEWVWSSRKSFESFLNPTKSFLASKSTLNSQVFTEPQQVQKSACKFHPALPDGFFPMFFQVWCLLGVGWWCDLLHLLGTRALRAQI